MKTSFIQVLLPLRLDWDPYYCCEDGESFSKGDRVEVLFSGRRYIGVVRAVDVTPAPDIKTILPARRCSLPPVGERELAFWGALGGYYLCSVGEVYKAAYPLQKVESEAVAVRVQERLEKRLAALQLKEQKARKDSTREQYRVQIAQIQALLSGQPLIPASCEGSLSAAQEDAVQAVERAFQEGKTVLLEAGPGRVELYLELARRTLAMGKSVLYLVPEIGLSRQLEERVESVFPQMMPYHSALTAAQRRGVSDAVRTHPASLVVGTRSALFLPYRNLGLILVDDEQDPSYKQDSPAPRYHARDAAILLARIHGSQVVLGSETPSLESLYNADNGLFAKVQLKDHFNTGTELVNMAAEMRKKGVSGHFSLKLLSCLHSCLDAGEKVLLVCRSKAFMPECAAELESVFGTGSRRITLCTPASAKALPSASFALVGILQADSLLAKEDFRCDERAMQLLAQLRSRCARGGLLLIQTFEPAHPAFQPWNPDRLLEERRQFAYPPVTRMVQIVFRDGSEKRLSYMSAQFFQALRAGLPSHISILNPYQSPAGEEDVRLIRVFLPRDKALQQHKLFIYSLLNAFEKERKYMGHIHLDVDPV